MLIGYRGQRTMETEDEEDTEEVPEAEAEVDGRTSDLGDDNAFENT